MVKERGAAGKKEVRLDAPQVPLKLEAAGEFMPEIKRCLADETPLSGKLVSGVRAEAEDFSGIEMRRGILADCVFQSSEYKRSSFVDMIFQNCDFSNSRFLDAYFERCQFISCKCIGCDMSGAALKHVLSQGSNWRYSYFDRSKWVNVKLMDTDFTEVSVSEAVLKNVSAKGTRFIRNNFFKTMLAGMDFRENEFAAPIVSDQPLELCGIKLSPSQAVDLVAIWKIFVEA